MLIEEAGGEIIACLLRELPFGDVDLVCIDTMFVGGIKDGLSARIEVLDAAPPANIPDLLVPVGEEVVCPHITTPIVVGGDPEEVLDAIEGAVHDDHLHADTADEGGILTPLGGGGEDDTVNALLGHPVEDRLLTFGTVQGVADDEVVAVFDEDPFTCHDDAGKELVFELGNEDGNELTALALERGGADTLDVVELLCRIKYLLTGLIADVTPLLLIEDIGDRSRTRAGTFRYILEGCVLFQLLLHP